MIVITDLIENEVHCYSDLKEAAASVGINPNTLRTKIKGDKLFFYKSCFIGPGRLHKSKRGLHMKGKTIGH